eukprot:GEMP01016600.1.p1 GENE.GEMP01016600.1~~GEMP01016600.1.p1  ORF type:complete len:453 (+),score=108.82 GEMP01016600.1:30-1388(+)
MDEEYDVIVCGTGLKECILSGLLSVSGKKVLHLDRNGYYGGDCASLNITAMYQKFRGGAKQPESYGPNRDWNVDLIPKFVMASGTLVKILLHTKVTKYLEWKVVDGTYVYQYQASGLLSDEKFIHKVPSNEREALTSPLMGLWEKRRCANFFSFINKWDDANLATHDNVDPKKHIMTQVYEKFGLQQKTIDFVGHACALYNNDDYLQHPCGPTIHRVKLYMASIQRYGDSPFIYPVYGLAGLPEGFSRLSAIYGGTYMLNKPVDELVYENGRIVGVRSGDEVARAPMVICDPSYVAGTKKIKTIGKIIRSICILGAPIPNTKDASSVQIIVPQRELNRKSDIYVSMVSGAHQISPKGKYVAIVSTMVETNNPEKELERAFVLLGKIEEKFTTVSDIYIPTDDGKADGVYVSSSYDPTSHFQSTSDEVLKMWRQITGAELVLNVDPDDAQEEE